MKYLEIEALTNLTAQLSEAPVGHRVVNGRLEVYSMKRAGSDKKFAYHLGRRYVSEMEQLEAQQLLNIRKQPPKRQRSRSVTDSRRNRRPTVSGDEGEGPGGVDPPTPKRPRSHSFDFTLDPNSYQTALGDFADLSTRRLMTDLILTLQASFPDYDFSYVKPYQFERRSLEQCQHDIFERLTEFAALQQDQQMASSPPMGDGAGTPLLLSGSSSTADGASWLLHLWACMNEAMDLRECDVYQFVEEDLREERTLWCFHYLLVNKSWKRVLLFTCSESIKAPSAIPDDEDEDNNRGAPLLVDADVDVASSQNVDDFDWDPSADVAGGIPISTV